MLLLIFSLKVFKFFHKICLLPAQSMFHCLQVPANSERQDTLLDKLAPLGRPHESLTVRLHPKKIHEEQESGDPQRNGKEQDFMCVREYVVPCVGRELSHSDLLLFEFSCLSSTSLWKILPPFLVLPYHGKNYENLLFH